MRKHILVFLILIISVSCRPYRKTKDGYKIKGKTEIIFNGTDNILDGKCLISGFVYSRDTKDFPISAKVKINEFETETDENGFFKLIVEPGTYKISTNFIGNKEEQIENVELKKNTRLIIIFELGTVTMY
ncbi:MAG: carboxypeptidase-like regulatory domain-containing protein [Flavobacteriaceae bacterium]|nr:carboxypeptidase-like regulatory domain-containing protein [Flavobacteriaceae bacterium]